MKIALVGNPNSGKSSLFNALTGLNQKVGNFPGVTVERKAGKVQLSVSQSATLIDLPGTYNLYPHAEDESIACEIIRNPQHEDHADVWVVVIDATQIRRGLLLCTQLIDLQLPTVLVVNMVDLIENSETRIDYRKLSQKLDIPVLPVSARYNKGIEDLKKVLSRPVEISQTRILKIPEGFTSVLQQIQPLIHTSNEYLAYQALIKPSSFSHLSAQDLAGVKKLSPITDPNPLIANELLVRYDRIDIILEEAHKATTTDSEKWTETLDKIFLHPFWGYFIFIGILLVIFQALFSLSEYPMQAIEGTFAWISDQLRGTLPAGMLRDLLIDGIVAGIAGLVVFVPQIAFLFFFIAVLEETGYMSRVVFLMDKVMRPFGFSGRSVIPLVGGMACAVPSIMMARTIPHPKERLITILVTPLMSCSARLPVYILLVSLFVPETEFLGGIINAKGLVMLGLYILGFVMALLAAFIMKILFQYRSDGIFVAEMPVYRKPRWQNVGITIWAKCATFITEAGKVIVIISVILWALSSFAPSGKFEKIDKKYEALAVNYPQSDSLNFAHSSERLKVSYAGIIGRTIEPAIKPLGYDWKIGIALITSFAAREVFTGTMGIIYGMGSDFDVEDEAQRQTLTSRIRAEYSRATAFSLIIFYAFAMQCISTLAVTRRETGSWKWAGVMLVYLTALAYVAAWITYNIV